MNAMNGRMFQFSSRDPHLLGFMSLNSQSKPCSHALVLIAGLEDGFLSLNYSPLLSEKLIAMNYSLIQVNLASSFAQFGFRSLHSDVKDLTDLVAFIKDKYKFEKIAFMGSSTGCQDILFFLRHSGLSNKINAVILQAAVSDRDYTLTLPDTPGMLKEARELVESNRGELCLTKRYYDIPITAERFLSLTSRLGDDDMFSIDLTDDDLGPILSPVKVPIALCFSAQDEYVPDLEGQKVFAQRMVAVLEKTAPTVECRYFNGNHSLSLLEYYEPLVDYVCEFISKCP